MKLVLTGVTGFTGSFVLRRLREAGIEPLCLVRKPVAMPHVIGDLADPASLDRAFRDADTLINVASLGFGHAPALVDAVERSPIRRAIFISTTAMFTKLNAKTKAVRVAAEERITSSSIDYTILRPTMIYGTSRDRNMCRLIRYLHRWPAIPVLGKGDKLQQPVYVDDVAKAVIQSLQAPATIRRAYNISGGTALTFDEVIDTIASLLHRRVRKLHLPAAPAIATLSTFERIGIRFPIKSEQLLRLNEDKAFDHAAATRDFGYAPISFSDGIRAELAEMGLGRSR
ncbi:MAG TPA: NAD-dependent epimerase/dehydratase family protein [Thermoanaerobaculia bacterium]|nr:NAD-dependent epimerase/dehydratase family protein [Thermoanaerobaculia bacterium]